MSWSSQAIAVLGISGLCCAIAQNELIIQGEDPRSALIDGLKVRTHHSVRLGSNHIPLCLLFLFVCPCAQSHAWLAMARATRLCHTHLLFEDSRKGPSMLIA